MKMRRKKISKNAGTSMIEVLVAVLVVMLMMLMFAKVMAVSVQILHRSQNEIAESEAFNAEYYLTNPPEEKGKKKSVEGSKLSLKSKDGGLEIELPQGKLWYYSSNSGKIRYFFATEPDNSSLGE